ncbi:flagellar export chaperone FliS [Granulicella arctica]|uniref:flagellar export chaperone FliS n=1 Tax=Granulicella arctica TaxID=940613 RepID=UPI0021E09975|nr:flagellar export chaperone FliS [Granulicella arctica]
MAAKSYQEQTLDGATGMQMVVALYDGAIRFLYRAIQSVEEDDIHGRRIAVKKVVDILMYLQARLRPDVGGSAATSLSDFYAAMFTLTLEASHYASKEQFQEVIACVRNVRDAWVIVAKDPVAGRILPRELRTQEERMPVGVVRQVVEQQSGSRWSA